jgi:uncharacterized protein
MKALRIAVVVVVAFVAFSARAAPASAESIERLLQVMQVQAQLETMYAQILPAMQSSMRQTLTAQLRSDQAARMLDAVQPRVNALVLEQMSWARLKPAFARIYAEAFSQEEVDGLIAFYQGPIGSALISKTPQLMQRSTQVMQERMGPMLQQVVQITKEEIEKERGRGAVRN